MYIYIIYIYILKYKSRYHLLQSILTGCNQPMSEIFIIDNTLSFYRQLSHITKLLNYPLYSLSLIRHSISISTATIIVSASILLLFAYCNFILYNIYL